VSLIYNPSQWKYVVDVMGFPAPTEYNMFTVIADPTQYGFFLEGGEVVTLVFRYLFYREPDPQYTTCMGT
jgi:hypothetical protein